MLAKVKDSPLTTLDRKPERQDSKIQLVPPPTGREITQQEIGVTFDPAVAPPKSQFTFTTSTLQNYLLLDGSTLISVTLSGGATFASDPVTWANPPSDGAPAVFMAPDLKTISFEAPAPAHYCDPWIFNLNVNSGAVKNITSPSFFLAKTPTDPQFFTLEYSANDGSFNLRQDGDQPGIVLADQFILVNVLALTYKISVSGATFYWDQPIVWNPSPPSFVKAGRDGDFLVLSFTEPINGQSAGFQFAVNVPDGTGKTMTVLSPDPIIINATIGDG